MNTVPCPARPVLCIGDYNADIVIVKRPGQTEQNAAAQLLGGQTAIPQGQTSVSAGGTVANTASGLARLEVPVSVAGCVGQDSFGRFSLHTLEEDGVDTSLMRFVSDAYTMLTINVEDEQCRRELSAMYPETGAAYALFQSKDVPDETLRRFGMLYTSGIILSAEPSGAEILDCMARCRGLGIPVAFDINLRISAHGWDGRLEEKFLRAVELSDIVFGSGEEEYAVLYRTADYRAAAAALGDRGKLAVCKNGAEDTLAFQDGRQWSAAAFPVTVADTLGAGDAFNAGFLAAMRQGLPVGECLVWGNATAACSIQKLGSRNCPDSAGLQAFLSRWRQ